MPAESVASNPGRPAECVPHDAREGLRLMRLTVALPDSLTTTLALMLPAGLCHPVHARLPQESQPYG